MLRTAKILLAAAIIGASAYCLSAEAAQGEQTDRNVAKQTAPGRSRYVSGGFEAQIFFDSVVGFQSFSRDPITEVADDGSYAGVLGEYIPQPPPGQDIFGIYVPKLEIDIMKRISDVARLRADISFGRTASGSYVGPMALNHAYAAVKLSHDYNVELLLGRFGGQAGYEPFRAYHNDTVSWSIMWRGSLYPPGMTGVQLSADLTNTMSAFFVVSNGNINDSSFLRGTLPSFLVTLEWTWGPEARPNQLVFTPWFGPESGGNRPFTYGADVTYVYWLTERLKLGLEACYQRNNAVDGALVPAEDTDYASGLMNLRWDITPSWYGVIKYVFARQFGVGNGVQNLTGAKQNIHETSLGFGYQMTDSSKVKGEFRFDVVDPDSGKTQTIPGAAVEYAWYF